jgi:hypothetical protein
MEKEIGRENGERKLLKCKARLPNGKECKKQFATPMDLAKHIQKAHPGQAS